MTDVMSAAERSALMARVGGAGNESTEIAMVKVLRKNRLFGWRRHRRITWRITSLPASLQAQQNMNGFRGYVAPDFVFNERRIVLFVDGCFWHSCPAHRTTPASNSDSWAVKLRRNQMRDRFVDRVLCSLGWTVLRVWEHELRQPSQLGLWLIRSFGTRIK